MHFFNVPPEVFDAYKNLGSLILIEPIDMGLINKTFVVTTAKKKFILQELSPIFETVVINDSDAIAKHLIACDIEAPEILLTDDRKLFIVLHGRVFRALKFIDGQTSHTVTSLKMAKSAGKVLGQFHLALKDFTYDYLSKRRHGGDYGFHKENLIFALNEHPSHDFFRVVEALAVKMIKNIDEITADLTTTARNAHGDPKISNIIFNAHEEALCLIDFDTLGKTGWSLEVADALRSWCNPHQEDILLAKVDLTIADSALNGYGSVMRGNFSSKESKELVVHLEAITLCLAMRYLADVLNEKYWAYDRTRFARPAEHHWLRAQAMFNLALEFALKKKEFSCMVNDYLL